MDRVSRNLSYQRLRQIIIITFKLQILIDHFQLEGIKYVALSYRNPASLQSKGEKTQKTPRKNINKLKKIRLFLTFL